MGKYGRQDPNGQYGRVGRANGATTTTTAAIASRVSKPAGNTNDKKVLSKFDARLKLIQKADAVKVARSFGQTASSRYILDARELLNRKQKSAKKAQMRKEIAYDRADDEEFLSEEEDDNEARPPVRSKPSSARLGSKSAGGASAEPVVIVTGLGNIRKNGDKLEVVQQNKRNSEFFREHLVLSNGAKTIVTLNNDLAKKRGQHAADADNVYEEEEEEIVRRGPVSMKNLPPIKIRVENELSSRPSADYDYQPTPAPPVRQMHSDIYYHSQQHDQPLRPSSSRLQPSSTIGYPRGEHLNGRLGSGSNGHHYSEPRPTRQEYVSSSSRAPPPSYHDQEMDYEESYNEPARQPPPPPSQIKSTLSSRGRSHHQSSSVNESGFRVVVSNLHQNVTQEDILELFSDIGPIKRAKFIDKGVAEVLYVNLDDAYSAIKKYDQKELDGRAMRIELTSNNAPVAKSSTYSEPTSNKNSASNERPPSTNGSKLSTSSATAQAPMASNSLSNRFKSYPINANVEKINLPEASKKSRNPIKVNEVDSSIIQQVLFNKKPANSNPVTFTVKL